MSKDEKYIVKGTKEGKLYIEPTDLFALESVQQLISRVVRSKVLGGVKKMVLK
jgi:hypothetical protein